MENHEHEKNETIRTEISAEELFVVVIKQLRRSFMVSGILQLPYLLLLFVFYNLALITTMDILYFPPLLDFTLKNYYMWNAIFIVLSGILILQLILGIFLKILVKKVPNKVLRFIIQFISSVQLLYLPIGTYYGLYELQLAKKLRESITGIETQDDMRKKADQDKTTDSEPASADLAKETNKKIGKIFIGVGVQWLGLLLFFILLTFYFTTVMLDMTYPYLTMSILLTARTVLGIMVGLSMAELLFGQYYYRIPESKVKNAAFWIFWVWSLILFPVGTSASRLLKTIKKPRIQSISK